MNEMLIGTYQHNIDAKGRFIMPSKFREELGDIFYITKGLDKCLYVFSVNEWEAFGEKIRSLPSSQIKNLQRYFFAGAAELIPDKQGRVLIPKHLREHAGLIKDIAVIGVDNKIEIWNYDSWNDFTNNIDENSVFETMSMLGI